MQRDPHGAVLSGGGSENGKRDTIIARRDEGRRHVGDVRPADVVLDKLQIDGFMGLVNPVVAVAELHQRHQMTFAAPARELVSIYLDIDLRLEALMIRE